MKKRKTALAKVKADKKSSTAAAPAVDVSAAKTSTALVIPKIKASAMSKDVGLKVIADLATVAADDEAGRALIEGAKRKRYDIQSTLTMAVVKAASNDDSIDLSPVFGDDAKKTNHLYNQIGIALGYREVVDMGDKSTITYVKATHKYFPAPGDDKDAPETIKKQSNRTNFLHRLKQCVQAAAGIIERKITAKVDKESGTLLLTGPAVQKQFGTKSVLLNEKQTVGEGDKKTKLKERPSFTAIAAAAAEDHGKTVHRGSNTRGASSNMSPAVALASIAKSLLETLAKIKGELTAEVRTTLESVQTAVDARLDA